MGVEWFKSLRHRKGLFQQNMPCLPLATGQFFGHFRPPSVLCGPFYYIRLIWYIICTFGIVAYASSLSSHNVHMVNELPRPLWKVNGLPLAYIMQCVNLCPRLYDYAVYRFALTPLILSMQFLKVTKCMLGIFNNPQKVGRISMVIRKKTRL